MYQYFKFLRSLLNQNHYHCHHLHHYFNITILNFRLIIIIKLEISFIITTIIIKTKSFVVHYNLFY